MRHKYFWLTLFCVLYSVGIFVFIIACVICETIVFNKIYCLLLLPLLIYLIAQTIKNYCELTTDKMI